jgi:predicted TIM-barrel enzyme
LDHGGDFPFEAAVEEEESVCFAEIRDVQEEGSEPMGILGNGGGLGE